MILESSKAAPENRADHDSPTIRVFQLKRQNRKHEHLAVDADVVRQRSPPVHSPKEEVKGKKRRKISATLPTSTPTSSTSGTAASTGTSQPSPPITAPGITTVTVPTTVTVVLVPSVTVITSGAQTLTIPAGTVTEVVIPSASVTVIVSGTQTFTIPAGVSFPEQSMSPAPLPSGGTTLLPGPGSGSTVTITQSNGSGSPHHHTLSSTVPPTITTVPAAVNPLPPSGTRRSTSTIAGAVVGGTVALILIILLIFCYRRRRQSRATGPTLLADPFQDQAWVPPHEEQRVGADITTPSPFRGDALSGASQSQLSSSVPPAKGEKKVDTHGRDASISTSHSPFASAEDSMVTMADLNLLRARILEVENMALRQRIADVENMAQAGPSNHADAIGSNTSLHPPRASESPPEYASPLAEAPSDSRA